MVFEACRDGGFSGWRVSQGAVEVRFSGKGPELERQAALRRLLPEAVEPAWLRQVHSAIVLDASPGDNGSGDALVTERRGLALTVVTADCVPVLLAAEQAIAAIHAGWRGLAQSILPATLDRIAAADSLRGRPSGATITAWIGPAIGSCCYEVGDDVARQVCAASSAAVAQEGPRGRPHLDLVRAARIQLERWGNVHVQAHDDCTRCNDARLWSYRRDGLRAGRNLAAIWRRSETTTGP